ncbi:hypothetical protein FQR65_LT05140 [Abscondita terminalis]|nr:hypothetical protein FQR65_LT05140 [Abscondita terminalis]
MNKKTIPTEKFKQLAEKNLTKKRIQELTPLTVMGPSSIVDLSTLFANEIQLLILEQKNVIQQLQLRKSSLTRSIAKNENNGIVARLKRIAQRALQLLRLATGVTLSIFLIIPIVLILVVPALLLSLTGIVACLSIFVLSTPFIWFFASKNNKNSTEHQKISDTLENEMLLLSTLQEAPNGRNEKIISKENSNDNESNVLGSSIETYSFFFDRKNSQSPGISHSGVNGLRIPTPSPTYYFINRGTKPRDVWDPAGGLCDRRRKAANSTYCFEIEADTHKIIQKWKKYFFQTKKNVFGENCAVAVQRFLTEFANIPESSHYLNPTWNYLTCGIFWPSVIPCPLTLPGRVMDNVKFYTHDPLFRQTSVNDLPENHKNKYLKEIIKHLKQNQINMGKLAAKQALLKFNTLNYNFFNCLHRINQQAIHLKTYGYINAAHVAKDLVEKLHASVIQYCSHNIGNQSYNDAFKIFKSNCFTHIKMAQSTLKKYQGWDLLLKIILDTIIGISNTLLMRRITHANNTTAYIFTLFKSTNSRHKIQQLEKEFADIETKNQAINARALEVRSQGCSQ